MKGKSKYAISPQSLAKIPSRIQKKSLGEKRSAMDLIDAIYQLLILLTLSILSVTSFRLLKKNCTISREKVRQEEKKLGVVTVCASREGLAPSCHFSYRPSWVVFFFYAPSRSVLVTTLSEKGRWTMTMLLGVSQVQVTATLNRSSGLIVSRWAWRRKQSPLSLFCINAHVCVSVCVCVCVCVCERESWMPLRARRYSIFSLNSSPTLSTTNFFLVSMDY